MDEVSLLILGTGDAGATFKHLPSPGENEKQGFLYRLIFGQDGESSKQNDLGINFSVIVLHTFLHDKANNDASEAEEIMGGALNNPDNAFDLTKIVGLVPNIDKTVAYRWPGLSTIVGIYILISLISLSVEVGIRMMKLLFMRLFAPLAITNIVDGGFKNTTWSGYVNTYLEIFTQLFFRISMFYVTMAFVVSIYNALFEKATGEGTSSVLDSNFLNIAKEGAKDDGITTALVFILLLVALFKFLKEAPKLIDSLNLFKFKLGENNFNKYMAQAAGGLTGGIAGAATGIAGGAGVLGTLYNTVAGAKGGADSAARGEGISGQVKNLTSSAENALNTKGQGGLVRRVRNSINSQTGTTAIRNEKIDARIKDNQKIIDDSNADIKKQESIINGISERESAAAREISTVASSEQDAFGRGIEYGVSDEDYAARVTEAEKEKLNDVTNRLQGYTGRSLSETETAEVVRLQNEQSQLKSNLSSDSHKEELREKWRTARDGSHALEGTTREGRASEAAAAKRTIDSRKAEIKKREDQNKSYREKEGKNPTMFGTMRQVRKDKRADKKAESSGSGGTSA